MAYKIRKTNAFQRDLEAIIVFTVKSLENKTAAASLIDTIEKNYEDLLRKPFMYEACHNPHLKELGYRKVAIHNHIMVYKVDEKQKTVNLMRLFHGRQDYEKLI